MCYTMLKQISWAALMIMDFPVHLPPNSCVVTGTVMQQAILKASAVRSESKYTSGDSFVKMSSVFGVNFLKPFLNC